MPLDRVVRAGVWNGIGWSADARAVAFWFLVAGAFALLAGILADHVEARGEPLPGSFGWGLSSLALLGAVALPVSGFWLLLVPGLGILRSRRAPASRRADRPPVELQTDPSRPGV